MPKKPTITKQMIIDTSTKIIEKDGIENLNVRNIARNLNCSTQPIMYHYKNMDMLKEELYTLIDKYHSDYIAKIENVDNPLLEIGIRYIKFAFEHKNLFKFLFQTGKFANFNFNDLVNENESELKFILDQIKKEAGIDILQAKQLFEGIFISAHGMASLIANNSILFNEEYCSKILTSSFFGNLEKFKED